MVRCAILSVRGTIFRDRSFPMPFHNRRSFPAERQKNRRSARIQSAPAEKAGASDFSIGCVGVQPDVHRRQNKPQGGIRAPFPGFVAPALATRSAACPEAINGFTKSNSTAIACRCTSRTKP